MNETSDIDLTKVLWRVGRKVGRTIYAQVGDKPTDDDLLIGILDSRELAKEAVQAHNYIINKLIDKTSEVF